MDLAEFFLSLLLQEQVLLQGASVRLVLEQVGINNILTKRQGSKNILNLVRATMNALISLKDAVKIANKRGVKIERVFN